MSEPLRTYLFLHRSQDPMYSFTELEVGVVYENGTQVSRKFGVELAPLKFTEDLGEIARDILVAIAECL